MFDWSFADAIIIYLTIMRRLLQKIFRPLFILLANRFSSAPRRDAVFVSLSRLFKILHYKDGKRGIIKEVDSSTDQFIIFSDQHKGNKDRGDDFKDNEANYIAALDYYYQHQFHFINLGDAEELWKYKPSQVLPQNQQALLAEAKFHHAGRYTRTFGNHDLLWKNKLDVTLNLQPVFGKELPVYEGLVLQMNMAGEMLEVFLTHGHQGDTMSDNNAFSTWLVAHIWAPIQRFLQLNVNTPANDFYLRDKHNHLMYEWVSRRKNILLVTGHTHKPVFASGKYAEQPEHTINAPEMPVDMKPSYFNTGCCCYNDGDITGIEIAGGYIRLIKWYQKDGLSLRQVLEERSLAAILDDM